MIKKHVNNFMKQITHRITQWNFNILKRLDYLKQIKEDLQSMCIIRSSLIE